eukprot:TRINITY_DN2336_c0_g1_i1.p1 TRINITY_DN2336_c0_g1~~TRINITY_DN2336_c0_g1_i1.p1  ORF type:complete len:240 (+),score=45.79 TRINITY_DN2336_c0_g1_i1:41-721(+)
MNRKAKIGITLLALGSITAVGAYHYFSLKRDQSKKNDTDNKELLDTYDQAQIELAKEISQEEYNNREKLIEEQNRAFEISLSIDREKEAARIEAELMALELKEAEENYRAEKMKRLKVVFKGLPREPIPGVEGTVDVKLIFPNRTECRRRFYHKDTFQMVKDFVDTRVLEEAEGMDMDDIPEDYYFVTDFPRREWRDDQMTLKEAGIDSRGTVMRIEEDFPLERVQ